MPAEVAHDPGFGDDSMPVITRWAEYFGPLVRQSWRVLEDGGALIVIGNPSIRSGFELAMSSAGERFLLANEFVVLWRGASTKQGRRKSTPLVESLTTSIHWYTKRGLRGHKPTCVVESPSNTVVCERIPVSDRYAPCQRPVELFIYLISLLTEPDGLVVDPYCGTGSSLVAAEIAERRWIGGDIDAGMVEIARRRVATIDHEEADLRPFYLWTPARLVELYG